MKKILFIVTEDWYFVSHRLHLAIAAMNNGYEVGLLSRFSTHQEFISSLGIKVFDWPMERRSHNLFKEFVSICHVVKAFRSFKPNLVHAVAIKPVIYSLVSNVFFNVDGKILALAGLGFVFRSEKNLAKFLRVITTPIFRVYQDKKNVLLVIQNIDDAKFLINLKIIHKDKIRLIRGAGVNTSEFSPNHEPHKIPLVVLPARMLWSKGVGDFVNCAKKFIKSDIQVKFALIGDPDSHNPESVTKSQLEKWVESGAVEWWGNQDSMSKIYHLADIVCFPSYHEGLPKSLLEAASCEIPIVAYDVTGCREVVKNNINGFLISFKDEDALYDAVRRLVENPKLRLKMGKDGREIVMENFTEERIAIETMKVWSEVLR